MTRLNQNIDEVIRQQQEEESDRSWSDIAYTEGFYSEDIPSQINEEGYEFT